MGLNLIPFNQNSAFAKPIDLPEKAKKPIPPYKAQKIEYGNLVAYVAPLYTTIDSPTYHETKKGDPFDGVGKLNLDWTIGSVGCSGSLLSTGKHILTAAHCLTGRGSSVSLLESGKVTFEGDDSDVIISIIPESSYIHPDWDGDVLRGNDIAVLELVEIAPPEITRYDIDTNGKDDIKVGEKIGYGASGFGMYGMNKTEYPFGTKRNGINIYDDVGDSLFQSLGLKPGKDFVRGGSLLYDFDNGLSENDAFGFFFGKTDLGFGIDEVASASGDSGSPTIQDGLITGVTSFGISLGFVDGQSPDVTPYSLDASIGEIHGDMRVSKYSAFIQSIIGEGGNDCPPGKAKKGLC